MKKFELDTTRIFDEKAIRRFLVHDSPYFRVINFNIPAGQTFPVHSHEVEGQLTMLVLEGQGWFLGADGATLAAKAGDILISDISAPHGAKADTDLRLLVTIAPPL